jgi:hypothetical protein
MSEVRRMQMMDTIIEFQLCNHRTNPCFGLEQSEQTLHQGMSELVSGCRSVLRKATII